MLERVAAWFLNTYVAEYVGNLNTDQLSIGLLSGAVELEKLTLKKDAFRKLRLPIEIKAGYIGKLRLKVPVRYMKSQPWVVEVDQLYIVAGPPDLTKFDPEEEKAAIQARKLSKLAAMEQKWREEQQNGKSSWFWSSFATSYSSTIAENLQVTINNIHIRYEDPEIAGGKPLVVGLIIDRITAQSTNENWEAHFSVGDDKSHKAVDITNLSVYWDENLLGDLPASEFMDAMLHKALNVVAMGDMMSSSIFFGHAPIIQHLVKPFSATAQITRNCSKKPLKIVDGPRVNVNMIVEVVPVVLSENQLCQFVQLSDVFQMRWKSQKYRELRPHTSVQQSPQVWWQFAIHSVRRDIKETSKRLSPSFIITRVRQCISYVSAYTNHLTVATPTEDIKRVLREVEESMNYEEIVILRRLAMHQVEKALAEEAQRVAALAPDQQGLVQRWFPGWISGYQDNPTTGETPANNNSLEDVDEEQLMDELGLEVDGNSQLLKDRIFAVISFSLKKGILNLVTEDNGSDLGPESILELELSRLSCHIDYRPRLKYALYELRLNGLYVEDNYHENSLFTTLVKPKESSPSDDLLTLRLIQQNRSPFSQGYSIHVVTRPLNVVFNQITMARLKKFFAFSSSVTSELSRGTSKVGGAMGGVNPKLLDSICIKLDISAPHIIIPEKFDELSTPKVIADLGHFYFESVSDWSVDGTCTTGMPLQESVYQLDEDTFLDIDDDEEFVTPPSSPPSENEGAEPSTPAPPTLIKEALEKNSFVYKKHVPHNKYLLKLSSFQLLVGRLDESSWNTKGTEDDKRLQLLDKLSLLVKIQRNPTATVDTPYVLLEASLPLLNFHIDERKISTLLACLIPKQHLATDAHATLSEEHVANVPPTRPDVISSLNSTSVYQSAYNVFDKPPGLRKQSSSDSRGGARRRYSSVPESSQFKLFQGKLCIDHFLVDLTYEDVCLAELKVLSVKGGVIKRLHDVSVRVIVQDLFLMDKMQRHQLQYELILSSNARSIFSESSKSETTDDVFAFEGDFLLNILFNHYSCLSPDYPSTNGSVEGADIRKLFVQCTAINAIANQELIVKFIGFCRDITTSSKHLLHTSPANNNTQGTTNTAISTTDDVPVISELSVEFEKLCLKLIRGSIPFDLQSKRTEPCAYILTAAIDMEGLGVQAKVGNEITIEGCLEGAMVRDLTQAGQKYPMIISVGKCREGRSIDMITSMLTSYSSLAVPAEVFSFCLRRVPRTTPPTHPTNIATVYDVNVTVRVPSILYTHSVNFVREMEIFTLEFKQYFTSISSSVKTAALEVAKGLVSDESQLVMGLNKLSSSLGGPLLSSRDAELSVDETIEVEEDIDFSGLGDVDRVLIDVLVHSPVVVLPSSMTSSDTIVAHLGEISLKNEYISLTRDEDRIASIGYELSSSEVDRIVLKISNMSLNASHDEASLDWLKQDCTNGMCAGRWSQVMKETSFELVIERVVGSFMRHAHSEGDKNLVDIALSCSLPNSLFVSLSKRVFDQIKRTAKKGIYIPLSKSEKPTVDTPTDQPHPPETSTEPDNSQQLPRIIANFFLPQLSIEFSHNIGDEEKKIVFVSFEEFVMRCRKTTPHHAHIDLGLKTVIVEDLLQKKDIFRYILSSTQKPLPFSSPVTTPSLLSRSVGISPRSFLPLSHLISSPKPNRHGAISPLRSFNPYHTNATPTDDESHDSTLTTPPNESATSSVTDVQDLVSISVHYVSDTAPDFTSKYKGIGLHADVIFSTVYLVVNLQTWVLFFDYLGIGVPTPPSSPTDDLPSFFQPDEGETTPTTNEVPDLGVYSLKPDGSLHIVTPEVSPVKEDVPIKPCKSTVWGAEGKLSVGLKLCVQSLTVTLNKPEHPLARGVASGLEVDATLEQSNVLVKGSLGQASLVDLTDTGAYYRDKFTTTGDQALSFEVHKFGQKDPYLERPYDISATVRLSAVRYLHTMRFLKEAISFLTHFPQLIDAFQRMKAAKQGNLNYIPDRKPRILLDVEADGPMILIPKHAFSPEIMGGVIKKLTLCNRFRWDGEKGTLSKLRNLEKKTSRFCYTNELQSSVPEKLSAIGRQPNNPLHKPSKLSLSSPMYSVISEDLKIQTQVAAKSGPCLLDCMELVLADVDVFSARKNGIRSGDSNKDGWIYQIERDKGKLLKEKGTLDLRIERNLYEDFCRDVPDIHIDGVLLAVHLMLDKRQLEIIKGIIDMNLGEDIDEFEKPSTVIHDPVSQHSVAAVWTGFRFHIEFIGVQLEFLQSRPSSDLQLPQSLALFDIQSSEFTFESHSNQSKNVDFTTHAVVGRDTRYNGYSADAKPNVYEEVLKYNHSATNNRQEATKDSLQFEIHVFMSPTTIKASILLNGLRLIGVFDLLLELKKFVIDKLPEEEEEIDHNTSLEEVDGAMLDALRSNIVSRLDETRKRKKVEKKPERDVTFHLSVTGTDFVLVEDLRNLASNAVVLKGTLVLTVKSPPKPRGSTTVHCSVDNLELFSCIVSNEDDTALSILDPVSIGVELKPMDTPTSKGTHILEFDVKQLNVRLSYNDIKLFVAILQSLKMQSLKLDQPKATTNKKLTRTINEKLVSKLLPLGFSRTAILHELSQSGGDIEVAASRLIQESSLAQRESEEDKEESSLKLDRIMVVLGTINLCLIDDSLNHDIPLVELTLGSLHANHHLIEGMSGNAFTQLALDYYNRNISAWEPIIEPWNVVFNWRKTTGFDLDTNEKPDRLSFGISSPEQFCINLTSSLLHLFKETQTSWQSDYNNDTQLNHTDRKGSSSSVVTPTPSSLQSPSAANVQQGLALLHTVRYISQSRQRNKFIPFALRNSTGLPLSFTTLTSLPSEVFAGSSVYMEHSRRKLATPPLWTDVDPMEEKPFDFLPHQKMRHKDTRALVVHQLKVKVDGWEETVIPISVDKIGVFFRELYPSVGSSRGLVRLVFAISLSDTRKVVNVRSGLVIQNTLELPMEIKMEPPSGSKCSSVSLPLIKPTSYYAVPLHITNWSIYIRPQGWGLEFCSSPIVWSGSSSSHRLTDNLKECVSIGTKSEALFRFAFKIQEEPFPLPTVNPLTPSPGHTISLHPPIMVSNLLPHDFCFCYSKKEKTIPHGKVVPFYTINPGENLTFSISKLEGFLQSETCIVSVNDVGVLQYLIVPDKRGRKLYLIVKTELIGQSSLKIVIWCPYWVVNRTGLPLVFSAEGDSPGEPAAGQYAEHESASTVTPLLYAYSDRDLIQKCQVCIGRSAGGGVPKWSSGFRMLKKSQVVRLFVKQGQGRPDREYQIGMEIGRGALQYNETRVVTFVARFQLENRTGFKLAYLQRHLLNNKASLSTILPKAIMAFHWPRTDLDQLLCIKILDLDECHWSCGFPLEHDKSFHINMRQSYGRSVFVRCEILQRGETYHVIFLDASDYPPPFKLENLSQVQVTCYQKGISYDSHILTYLNPGQSVPYAWDDVIRAEKLCIRVKTSSEPRCFDLETVGSKGKVYYESYFYIVATGTATRRSEMGVVIEEELVLDVPQGKAVILTKKDIEKRTQLWRMTAEGHLVHVASSNASTNHVLDLTVPIVKNQYRNVKNVPLIVSRASSKKSDSQTWEFTQDGHLVLMNYHCFCVQVSEGYDSSMEGVDAVLGRVGAEGWREEIRKVKQSPGSGVLSVAVAQDGPTRILRITDENKKYTYRCVQDDWIIVDNGIVSPSNVSDVDPPEIEPGDEEKGPITELSLSLSLDKGIGISLINSLPEELLFASASGIRLEYISTAVHQCVNATIQYIQVDNQIVGSYSPVLIFPSPSSGEIEFNYPVLSCFIERLPHQSPFAVVFRTFEFKLRELTILMEERLLFKLLQWAGIGVGEDTKEESIQEEMMTRTMHRSPLTSSFPSHQVYVEQLKVGTTNLLVCMHTTSQLPPDLAMIKRRLGFPLIQFESPIVLEGFQTTHMLGTPLLFVDTVGKHYRYVLERQAIKILGSFDFLGNPVGLISDVASGVQGMIALNPDVVGLVRDVTHGMSDTTSKLTGTVSHVLGQATGDSSYQEEREQNLVSCQSSGDHFQAGLINLTGGLFGGVTSIITQPYKGAVEDGIGGFLLGIGKGVVGTVAKPVAGLLDFASGTTAALRESLSRFNRGVPQPVRLKRCCVGATGALTCYSLQLARGEEYLMRLNDGDNSETLVSYERFEAGTAEEMRVIISSQALYFFEESPPDPTSLNAHIQLDNLTDCKFNKGKTTIPVDYIVLSVQSDELHGKVQKTKRFKCHHEQTARKIVQLINYAKNLHEEAKLVIRKPRLQNQVLW